MMTSLVCLCDNATLRHIENELPQQGNFLASARLAERPSGDPDPPPSSQINIFSNAAMHSQCRLGVNRVISRVSWWRLLNPNDRTYLTGIGGVAVGTRISPRPPHRSRRA